MGFVNQQPHFSFSFAEMNNGAQFTIDVTSSCDPTLLINLPSTEWRFDDDGAGNLQPMLNLLSDDSLNGRLDVWVGTYDGAACPVTLEIGFAG